MFSVCPSFEWRQHYRQSMRKLLLDALPFEFPILVGTSDAIRRRQCIHQHRVCCTTNTHSVRKIFFFFARKYLNNCRRCRRILSFWLLFVFVRFQISFDSKWNEYKIIYFWDFFPSEKCTFNQLDCHTVLLFFLSSFISTLMETTDARLAEIQPAEKKNKKCGKNVERE